MKFIFPILAIIVCLGAAYFSWTESEKFTRVQSERLEAIATNNTVTDTLDAANAQIVIEEGLLADAKDRLSLLEQSVSALESDAVALKRDVKKLETRLAAQNAEIQELEVAMAEVEKVFIGLGIGEEVNIDNLGAKIGEIEADLTAKTEKSEELDELLKAAAKTLEAEQENVNRLVARKVARNKRISVNSLVARVTAVDQDWGFLVIGAGSNSGVTSRGPFIVQRNGKMIGRVTPSSVEPSQTIADIDLESIAPGVRIQPGDKVILEKPATN